MTAVDASPINLPKLSIIIPVHNEEAIIGDVLDELSALYPDAEIVVVNDGSTDDSVKVIAARPQVRLIDLPYNMGNGAAIKNGIWAASGDVLVMMDGDGQHKPIDVARLVKHIDRYDMVVGARTPASETQWHRDVANWVFNRLATYIVNRRVMDLTSGFRVIRATLARRFAYLLPNGYSYPTTLTITMFRAGHTVRYEPIVVKQRVGKSGIKLLRDGIRFLLILLRMGTLFAPIKVFMPVAALLFTVGSAYGAYLLIFQSRFSNMAILLILSGILLLMLGLLSEQIAMLRMSHVGSIHEERKISANDSPPEA
ncbi:MAG: glycosyltransferase family 2 protein [Chloroflexi bacterium]|nr:glycosyltransferase family 2 protein [Chloroflexota bacterium]